MEKIPHLVPVSDLHQKATEVLEQIKQRKITVITQEGRAAGVLLSLDAYEQAEQQQRLLLRLLDGEREIAAGEGAELDDLMRKLDEMIPGSET